ncbi:type VI secretion system baseplate subunit TssG [Burkholderia sp. WAC0059]|uniref:type VI secretion system baseplate subunit TssG n=1 Tax=Burkholderia sp. WAC0059 TaxID=2066022 RepID=UPI000C7EC98F|nr:type VI secretion system baseplate subunit TssG [Burkholderia sp. WAC0059]PLY99966.1 type VI secretion system baseplate subunit TssG [Burkholderia sp. WAC0059]
MEAMGADGRLPAAALIRELVARPQRFDLFQAISLLERIGPRPLGHGDGSGETVRLRGRVSLAFEASDVCRVREISPPDDAAESCRYILETSVLTLAGANGPLPMPFTELVLARRSARDYATADLLDIFNHRFLAFLYRGRKKHVLALDAGAPESSALVACLDALGGLGLRSGARDPHGGRLWISHAGLFGGTPRSMAGLLALLSDRLGLKVRGTQFVGCWREVDARDTLCAGTALRESGASRLGGRQVLGRRVWDQAGGIRLNFDDLSPAAFESLLPGGAAHALTAWLVDRYLPQALEVQCVLHRVSPIPACVLGGVSPVRLGWTSWLASRSAASGCAYRASAQVRIALHRVAGAVLH